MYESDEGAPHEVPEDLPPRDGNGPGLHFERAVEDIFAHAIKDHPSEKVPPPHHIAEQPLAYGIGIQALANFMRAKEEGVSDNPVQPADVQAASALEQAVRNHTFAGLDASIDGVPDDSFEFDASQWPGEAPS